MQEHTVTVMGVSRKLNEPFFVLATQNPIEQDGTYPLPEAQMDRFMFKLIVKNPSLDELMNIVSLTQKTMAEVAEAACNGEDLLEMRATANQIPVADEVLRYAMTLCSATHPDSECASQAAKKYVRLGASPRAGQAIISAAKVKALLNGRFNVSYNDINSIAYPVLRHRMKMNFEAIAGRVTPDMVIKMILDEMATLFKLEPTAKPLDLSENVEQAAPAPTAEPAPVEESAAQADEAPSKKSKRRFSKK
ncbi:MAG: MoxR family ATPase [Clostridiales bacterium]|nr:MoxR family ATPase [Clostridiales bacterium]